MTRPLPDGDWPTREAAASSQLYSPQSLGPVVSLARSWVPAMVPWRATQDGVVTERNLDWYGRFAAGKPGVLVVEATGIRDVPSGPLLRIGDDRFIPGMRRLVERVREESQGETRLLIQLIDFLGVRRRPDPARFFAEFLQLTDRHRAALADSVIHNASDTAVRSHLASLDDESLATVLSTRELNDLHYGARESVNDCHLSSIAELPSTLPPLFAAASRRALEAGFDGVELHYAHAYTMASFLSRTNTRVDGYGSSVEGRLRLPLEVYSAVRAAVGDKLSIGCRMLTDEIIDGGSRVGDAISFATAFSGAGMDFISLSRGGKFDDARQPRIGKAVYPYTGPSGKECMPTIRIDDDGPFGRNASDTGIVRAALRDAGYSTPVVVAGGLCSFSQVEELLHNGTADFVGAARQSLADPDWWLRMGQGRGASIRRCAYTNYCEGLDQAHREVTCRLWDRLPLAEGEGEPDRADDGRRLLPPSMR